MSTNISKKILGVDLGSRNVKIAFMENGSVTTVETVETIEFYKKYGVSSDSGFHVDLSAFKCRGAGKIIATGYGRMAASVTGGEIHHRDRYMNDTVRLIPHHGQA